jgi:hypothetical protein
MRGYGDFELLVAERPLTPALSPRRGGALGTVGFLDVIYRGFRSWDLRGAMARMLHVSIVGLVRLALRRSCGGLRAGLF